MGLDLVNLALLERTRKNLSPKAFAVLVAMARTALDKPNGKGQPARLYFAGWQLLAQQALGLDPEANPGAAYELVRRPLQELKRKGSIEALVEHPGTRRQQAFRLTLDLADCPHDSVGAGAPTESTPSAPTESVGLPPPNRGALGEQGPIGGLTEGPTTHPASSATGPRASGPHTFQDDGSGITCSGCECRFDHPIHYRRTA